MACKALWDLASACLFDSPPHTWCLSHIELKRGGSGRWGGLYFYLLLCHQSPTIEEAQPKVGKSVNGPVEWGAGIRMPTNLRRPCLSCSCFLAALTLPWLGQDCTRVSRPCRKVLAFGSSWALRSVFSHVPPLAPHSATREEAGGQRNGRQFVL